MGGGGKERNGKARDRGRERERRKAVMMALMAFLKIASQRDHAKSFGQWPCGALASGGWGSSLSRALIEVKAKKMIECGCKSGQSLKKLNVLYGWHI